MMPKLLFGSCQAPNADDFMRDVFRFVQQSVEIEKPRLTVVKSNWPGSAGCPTYRKRMPGQPG
jgi:hypothetical protein